MRCLVTGAYGFIGSEVVAALRREGVSVIGAGRDLALARRVLPGIEWIACDFNSDVTPADWAPRLAGIDAVVNCVGILQGACATIQSASTRKRPSLCSRPAPPLACAVSCMSRR